MTRTQKIQSSEQHSCRIYTLGRGNGAPFLAPGLRLAAKLSMMVLSASLSVADTLRLSSDFSALRALGLPPSTCMPDL